MRKIAGLHMRRECRDRFPRHRRLAVPTCITARAWRTCHCACRDRLLAVSFEVGGGENVPAIPGACATRNFAHLVRGPWKNIRILHKTVDVIISQLRRWFPWSPELLSLVAALRKANSHSNPLIQRPGIRKGSVYFASWMRQDVSAYIPQSRWVFASILLRGCIKLILAVCVIWQMTMTTFVTLSPDPSLKCRQKVIAVDKINKKNRLSSIPYSIKISLGFVIRHIKIILWLQQEAKKVIRETIYSAWNGAMCPGRHVGLHAFCYFIKTSWRLQNSREVTNAAQEMETIDRPSSRSKLSTLWNKHKDPMIKRFHAPTKASSNTVYEQDAWNIVGYIVVTNQK